MYAVFRATYLRTYAQYLCLPIPPIVYVHSINLCAATIYYIFFVYTAAATSQNYNIKISRLFLQYQCFRFEWMNSVFFSCSKTFIDAVNSFIYSNKKLQETPKFNKGINYNLTDFFSLFLVFNQTLCYIFIFIILVGVNIGTV